MSEPIETDYVIVGGGSAGCVLANRLSENPKTQVVLLEAGGEGRSALVSMPAGMAKLIGNPRWDWCYLGEVDASIKNRRFLWSAGKLLGGGSSINGQVYIRGLRSDYVRWVEAGCGGWSFDEVLPYFKKSERYEGEAALPSHGREGQLSVSDIRSPHPLSATFIQACSEQGLPTLKDYCAGEQFGAFFTLATQRAGLRCSSAAANLDQAATRQNLQIMTDCTVERILMRGTSAVGVEVRRAGEVFEARARAEVLVSAGTVGSPSLLMRSGIGPGEHLSELGLAVQVSSTQVGRNLQEHPGVAVSKQVRVPTYNSKSPVQILGELLRFVFVRRGMLTTPAVQAMAFAKTQTNLADPDVQLHFLPLCYEVTPETLCSANAVMPKQPAAMIMANVCRPHSRGEVRLRGADPALPPLIDHQMLGDERDVENLIRACHFVERLFAKPALRAQVSGNFFPPSTPGSDAEWSDYVRSKVVPCYHPVGTCRMGGDAASVVDPELKVRGADRLRVIDASVIPFLPSANTNAPTMMVAEKAAAMMTRR